MTRVMSGDVAFQFLLGFYTSRRDTQSAQETLLSIPFRILRWQVAAGKVANEYYFQFLLGFYRIRRGCVGGNQCRAFNSFQDSTHRVRGRASTPNRFQFLLGFYRTHVIDQRIIQQRLSIPFRILLDYNIPVQILDDYIFQFLLGFYGLAFKLGRAANRGFQFLLGFYLSQWIM